MPIFFLCMLNIYILSPSLLKFAKVTNITLKQIKKDSEKLESLAGNLEENSHQIEGVQRVQRLNKRRRRWFVLSIVMEMLWLCAVSLDDPWSQGLDFTNRGARTREKASPLLSKWV